jgi:hypothetical protein
VGGAAQFGGEGKELAADFATLILPNMTFHRRLFREH